MCGREALPLKRLPHPVRDRPVHVFQPLALQLPEQPYEKDLGVSDDTEFGSERAQPALKVCGTIGVRYRSERAEGATHPAGRHPHVVDAFLVVQPNGNVVGAHPLELLDQNSPNHLSRR